MKKKFHLMYYHRLPFPSASGQTIAIIRDFFAVSRRIGTVHLFYRGLKAYDEANLDRLLGDYGGAIDDKFHFHCIEDGWFGKRRTMAKAMSLVEATTNPFFVVARTFAQSKAGLALRNRYGKDRVKVVMELHQDPFPHLHWKEKGRPVKAFLKWRDARRIYMRADGLLCNTWPQVEYIDRLFPGHARVEYLPSGCPDHFFSENDGTSAEKKDGDKVRIRYAGRFSTWKNPEIMVEALRHLPEHYVLDLAGGRMDDGGESARQVETMAQRHGVPGRVNYVGFLPPVKVSEFLKGADCLFLPLGQSPEGKFFTSPLKLFEYAASAKPMAVTRVPSTEGLVKDGEHALMAVPGSASDAARAIRQIAEDKALAKRLAQNAKAWARQYSVGNRAVKYVEFLKTLLA